MATEKNIVMKEFNGTDYDTLYPKTIGTQVDGIFTAEQTLTNNTKTLYGLGTDAVPDDVFAWLGKYNQYWWKQRVYVESSGYEEKQTAASDSIYLQYTSSTTTSRTIEYADSIAIDQSTGAVSLKNPSTVKVSYQSSASTLKNLLAGKYITNAHTSPSKIFYIKTDIGTSASSTVGQLSVSYVDDYYYVRITALGLLEITSQTVDTSTIGDWSYLQSSNRNAYPDSGITDGYEYMYLGRPFDNAVLANTKAEFASVTRTGTGTSTFTITIPLKPKLVFIGVESNTTRVKYNIGFGVFNDTRNYGFGFKSISSNGFSSSESISFDVTQSGNNYQIKMWNDAQINETGYIVDFVFVG